MPNRGLVSFTCGPLEEWTVNPCPFFSCHSWFYRPSSYPPQTSLSRMNFGSQLSWSILIWKEVCVFDHSCFASLNLTHFYYMLSELGGGAGEPQRVFEVNHGLTQWHDKILWFVLYLFPSNIYYPIYLFDCCWTLWLHFHWPFIITTKRCSLRRAQYFISESLYLQWIYVPLRYINHLLRLIESFYSFS